MMNNEIIFVDTQLCAYTFAQIYKHDEFYAATNNSTNETMNFATKTISIQFSLDIPSLLVLTELPVKFVRTNSKIRRNMQQKPKTAKICIFFKKR